MELIVARKLCSGLRKKKCTSLKPNRIQSRKKKKNTWENAARFAYDVYEGFLKK